MVFLIARPIDRPHAASADQRRPAISSNATVKPVPPTQAATSKPRAATQVSGAAGQVSKAVSPAKPPNAAGRCVCGIPDRHPETNRRRCWSWTCTWCLRHNNARFDKAVSPPLIQCLTHLTHRGLAEHVFGRAPPTPLAPVLLLVMFGGHPWQQARRRRWPAPVIGPAVSLPVLSEGLTRDGRCRRRWCTEPGPHVRPRRRRGRAGGCTPTRRSARPGR